MTYPMPRYTKAVHPVALRAYTEADMQKAVAGFLLRLEGLTRAFTFSHPPNESRRSPWQGAELKRSGMRAGDPDLFLFFRTGKVVFVELKTMSGRLQDSQASRIETLKSLGFECHVIKSATPADAVRDVSEILRRNGVKA